MKHLIVTTLALALGIFVGFGMSYTVRQPDTAPEIRQNEKPDTSVGLGEPIVVFAPGGLFSAQEKNKLTRDVVQPLVIFQQTVGEPLVSVMISKSLQSDMAVRVTAIQQNGAYAQFSQSIAEAWLPECFGQNCNNIPEKFRILYPALYQEAFRRAQ